MHYFFLYPPKYQPLEPATSNPQRTRKKVYNLQHIFFFTTIHYFYTRQERFLGPHSEGLPRYGQVVLVTQGFEGLLKLILCDRLKIYKDTN